MPSLYAFSIANVYPTTFSALFPRCSKPTVKISRVQISTWLVGRYARRPCELCGAPCRYRGFTARNSEVRMMSTNLSFGVRRKLRERNTSGMSYHPLASVKTTGCSRLSDTQSLYRQMCVTRLEQRYRQEDLPVPVSILREDARSGATRRRLTFPDNNGYESCNMVPPYLGRALRRHRLLGSSGVPRGACRNGTIASPNQAHLHASA
jgi:hypothetical protein